MLALALAACVPPAPMAVAGSLPLPSTTYSIIGDDGVAQVIRQPLIDALAARGLRDTAVRPIASLKSPWPIVRASAARR